MATIDPSIALGVKPIQIENPMNRYAAMSQIQSNEQANQLNAMKMQEYERGLGEENKLRALFGSGIDMNSPEAVKQMYAISPTKGLEYQQKQQLMQTQKVDQQKKITELTSQMKRDLSRSPTNANIQAHFEDFVSSGLFNSQQISAAQNTRDQLLAMPLQDRQAFLASQGASASDLKPTIKDTNLGGSELTRSFDPYSGAPTTISSIKKTMTPGEAASNAISGAHLKLAQDKAIRDQTIGTIPSGYRLGADGKTLELMAGGPTSVALAPKEIQKREAVLPQARQAVKTVSNTMSVIGDTVDGLLANQDGINGITGLVYGNTLAITDAARKAKADLETLKNLAFVQGITELRNASKTGAGVGNVTNREGDRFENMKASLDRSQSKEDLINSLKKLKQQAQLTSQFTNEAFDETYSYKNNAETMQQPPTNSTNVKPSLNEIFSSPTPTKTK